MANAVIPRTSARSSLRSCWVSCWTTQDRPIASFLWPGNTADVTTLLPVVERLRSRFGVERACIVADRGMISAATIAALEAQKIDYILGARERSSKEVRETVLHDDGAAVPLTIPRQKGETDLAVKEVKIAGRRYIVCRNEEEARKDAETRDQAARRAATQTGGRSQGLGRQHRLPPLPGRTRG